MWLKRRQVRPLHHAGVKLGSNAKNAQPCFGSRRQGVVDGLDKRRQVVGRVVIDEQDFVVRVGQHFGDAVDADGGALVKIVTVRVVAPVQNYGNHKTVSFRSNPANPQFSWLKIMGAFSRLICAAHPSTSSLSTKERPRAAIRANSLAWPSGVQPEPVPCSMW